VVDFGDILVHSEYANGRLEVTSATRIRTGMAKLLGEPDEE
jgi:hypothetical protein